MANGNSVKLAVGVCASLLVSIPVMSADTTSNGMYLVAEDVDYARYLVDASTITTPREGYRRTTVYRTTIDHAMGVYNGNLQSWEVRCKPLGVKLLADHDYQQMADGTWGDADGSPAGSDFTPMAEGQAMGAVAKFACMWPKIPRDALNLGSASLPVDPKERIEFLLTHLSDN